MAKRVLIVDDERAIRSATRLLLGLQNFEICGEAVDGLDALDKVRDLKPDLIIMDLAMPRMNGLRAAHELRALKVPTPIILFTMYADAVQPQNRSDVNAVVYKLDTVELQRQVARLLNYSSVAS
jgi:DNA-binding NarL/FixJ family response regulator